MNRRITVSVFWDDRTDPANPGWVARATEYDEDGRPYQGMAAIDEALEAVDEQSAIAEAARYFRVAADEVTVIEE